MKIILEAKILAIADVYDALTSDWVYHKRSGAQEAIKIMLDGRGTHFDNEKLTLFVDSFQISQ